jgi:hypothetical protein
LLVEKNYKGNKKENWEQGFSPQVDIGTSDFRESGRTYTHSKAPEKLIAKGDNHFIKKCPHIP